MQNLNAEVQRVSFEKDMVVDVPLMCTKVSAGERFRVEVVKAKSDIFKDADCALQGLVYSVKDGYAYWSCGGLLAKIPQSDQKNEIREGVVCLIRSRRRRRGGE